jgi:hypothetical protein
VRIVDESQSAQVLILLFHRKLIDDIVYEVDAQMVTIKPGADVDIGANASAEEATEALEEGAISVNNIAHSFRLSSTSFDKKSYLTYLKVIDSCTFTYIYDSYSRKFLGIHEGRENASRGEKP